ncbi:MAG: response regulator [Lentisphaerae bacterium GWF2_44_16]|nr:MAG: response regulator [Lentisphaerae bacterium GWF2_44_16]
MDMKNTNLPPLSKLRKKYGIRVLLVDDQRIIGEAIRRMLVSEKDIDFHFCQDPLKAIDTALEISPTVILQDLVMPNIDGMELVREFRKNTATKDIPLIVLTSEENSKVKAEAFAFDASDYIVKLPDKIELIARIRHHSRGYIHMLERNEAFDNMLKTRNTLAAELAEAADYVLSLLPPEMQENPEIIWKFIPSTSLGGDAFGYHWLDEDNFAIYLLDVSGHGVGAALLSVTAIEVLRSQTLLDTDFHNPANVLAQLNKTFKMQEHNQKYFTIWYGIYNKISRKIIYSSGGHPPAILITGDAPETAQPAQLSTHGAIIGAMEDVEYENATVELKPFNRLFIYSDGTFEIVKPDGNIWEFRDFFELLTTPSVSDYPNVDEIYKKITTVRGREFFDDDFSILRASFKI